MRRHLRSSGLERAFDGLITGVPSRKRRAFRPEAVDALEVRALLSSATRTAQPWLELANQTYSTGNGPSERLDVYLPQTPAPSGGWPVLVAIHGGGWRRFNKEEYGRRIAEGFVPDGYVVVAPNYELSAPGRPTWPINLEDVQAAVTWTRSHAGELSINPAEVAAIGESAGANLAALLGTDSEPWSGNVSSASVGAVVAFSTPTDLAALYSESPSVRSQVSQFLGGTPRQVPAAYAAASPIDHISQGDPPIFLVHGTHDPMVPVSQSIGMAHALSVAGVPNRLVLVPGDHNLDFPLHFAKLIPQILEFLSSTWKDK
jgi:acetyl esterase/lipase